MKTSSLVFLAITLNSCGDILSGITAQESETAYIQSAMALFTQGLNVIENVEPFALRNLRTQEDYIPNENIACTTTASGISASSCSASGVQSFTYNDCQGQFTQATYSGILNLDFSGSTCTFSGLSTDGQVVISSATHQTTGSDGTIVKWSTASHQNFLGSTLSGGYTLTKENSSTYYLAPTGIQRTKTTAASDVIFNHTLRANNDSSLTLGTGFTSANRSITGSIAVDSNTKEFTATLNFIGVEYDDPTCAYPTVGTIDVTFGGSKSGTQSFGFESGSCGTVKDTLTNTVYTLDAAF